MSKLEKLEIVKKWIDTWKHLDPQGSPGWLAKRPKECGGSELHTLLTNPSAFVAGKIGFTSVPNMLSMRWGTMFEPIIRSITMILFKTPIYEAGSIPSAEVDRKTYSMDGIGVVDFLNNGVRTPQTTLFEYKGLISRESKEGEVYPGYIPQVLSGMSDLVLPECAIYVEATFRLCKFEDLGPTKTHNLQLHKKQSDKSVLTCGFIGVYANAICAVDGSTKKFEKIVKQANQIDGGIDFGDESEHMEFITKCMKQNLMHTWFSTISLYEFDRIKLLKDHDFKVPRVDADFYTQFDKFVDFCNTKKVICIGFIPWKLFDMNIVHVPKVHGYTLSKKPQIDHAMDIVYDLQKIDDYNLRKAKYEEYFPHKKTVVDVEKMKDITDIMNQFDSIAF